VNREQTANEPRTFAVGTANADRERKDPPTKWGSVAFAVRGWTRSGSRSLAPTLRSPPATGGRGGSHSPSGQRTASELPSPRAAARPVGDGCHVIALSGPVPLPGIRSLTRLAVRPAAARSHPVAVPIHSRLPPCSTPTSPHRIPRMTKEPARDPVPAMTHFLQPGTHRDQDHEWFQSALPRLAWRYCSRVAPWLPERRESGG
jgi:hypothetical protein